MFHVDSQGILTLDSQSKNKTLVRVNGIGVFGKKQLWDGDVLTIGRYSSVTWMTLDVKTKRVVTPETKKLPTKKLIKRRRETSDGVRVEKDSVGTKSVCTMDGTPSDSARKSIVWLKTTPGRRRYQPKARPSSPVDLFESLESVGVSVTPTKRRACEGRHVVERLEALKDPRTVSKSSRRPRKKLRTLIGYKHGESTVRSLSPERCYVPRATSIPVINEDDDVTPDPRGTGPLRLSSLIEGAGSECAQLNALAVEHANSTSSKKALETQAARHNDTPPCSNADESVLSLPQCPTYDGESSDLEGGSPFVDGEQILGEVFDGQDSDPISEVCR